MYDPILFPQLAHIQIPVSHPIPKDPHIRSLWFTYIKTDVIHGIHGFTAYRYNETGTVCRTRKQASLAAKEEPASHAGAPSTAIAGYEPPVCRAEPCLNDPWTRPSSKRVSQVLNTCLASTLHSTASTEHALPRVMPHKWMTVS